MMIFDQVVIRTPTLSLQDAFNVPKLLPDSFREGLYLASPDFYRELNKKGQPNKADEVKLKKSLLKYWLRSSMRCTPFGTFAGTTVVPLNSKHTDIILQEANRHIRHVRLDMEYIYFLIGEIEKLPLVREQVLLYKNNSIYETSTDLRYTESINVDSKRDYRLTSVEKVDYTLFALEKAAEGVTLKKLSFLLSQFAKVDFSEARNFILELWESQLLISELEPCVTGYEPFRKFCSLFQRYEGHDDLKNLLSEIQNRLAYSDQNVGYYKETESLLRKVVKSPPNVKNFMQTDISLSCETKSIDRNVIMAVAEQAENLMLMANKFPNPHLVDFKKKFIERYENQAISLTIALDADLGIGYAEIDDNLPGGSPLINDIGLSTEEITTDSSNSFLQDFTLQKYLEYIRNGDSVIKISDIDLGKFKNQKGRFIFPTSVCILGSLLMSNGRFDKNNFLFSMKAMGGPSAVNLLGRFTLGDEDISKLTREVLSAEERDNPDVIFAEIAHLPQAKVGNVLLRSTLRDFEIPYVGKSGVSDENQLFISDLSIVVRNNELILFSQKLKKRVVPRLTTAHNFNKRSLPIYRFLCDLQFQDLSIGGYWDWGKLDRINHLPRVIYKNIIIKRARWIVELDEISTQLKKEHDLIDFFKIFRQSRNIPVEVLYVEADNQILINFENKNSIDILITYLKRNKKISLEEFLFSNDNCIVKDKEGRPYTNEILIPVQYIGENSQRFDNFSFESLVEDKKYPQGSEWIYFKVYCSLKNAEKFLVDYLLPFIETERSVQLFEKCFFIRYKDPKHHLRIRFYNNQPDKNIDVLRKLWKILTPLVENGFIENVVLDTYVQETQRYSDNLVVEAEELFDIDSQSTLQFLSLLKMEEGQNSRVFLAMRMVDTFTNDFKLTALEKRELFKKLSDGFLKEFEEYRKIRRSINDKYKALKKEIISFMNPRNDLGNNMDKLEEILAARSARNAPITARESYSILKENNTTRFYDLLASYIHMSLNRLFINHQRKYELLIYHFLERYYNSEIAISSKELNR